MKTKVLITLCGSAAYVHLCSLHTKRAFIISPGQSVLLQDEAQHSGLSDGHVAINMDNMEPRHRHQLQLIDEQVICLS